MLPAREKFSLRDFSGKVIEGGVPDRAVAAAGGGVAGSGTG